MSNILHLIRYLYICINVYYNVSAIECTLQYITIQNTKVLLFYSPQAAVQKRKISDAQNAMARAQLTASQSFQDDDEDEEDSSDIYEALWDAVTPPVSKDSDKIPDASKFDLQQCHIEDFNMIKVLGKGSFGKVY